jgi:hypothetical protein
MADDDPSNGGLPPTLGNFPDELIGQICSLICSDYCIGVRSVVALSSCSKSLFGSVTRHACVARCTSQYEVGIEGNHVRQPTLELLGVCEAVCGLGTTRIYFRGRGRTSVHDESEPDFSSIRPGSSMPRLVELALLMRRHPRLTVSIEGHEAPHEGTTVCAEDGSAVQISCGASHARAEAVRNALIELECSEHVTTLGQRLWGKLPVRRFAERITNCRGWGCSVVQKAAWHGPRETFQAELFFELDGVEVPQRDGGYARGALEAHAAAATACAPACIETS